MIVSAGAACILSATKCGVGDRFDDWVVGYQFEPNCLHHPVLRYRTPRVIRAFVPRIAGFFDFALVSASVSARQESGFYLLSLHRKIPFLTRILETGSMTGWWVASLCPSASTIQSYETANPGADTR